MMAAHLRTRETNVSASWVKGHAKEIDVERGRTTWEDKAGDDGADELAVAGAKCHEIQSEVVWDASMRKHAARQVQRMMVRILQARTAEEARMNGAGAEHDDIDDHASEASSCMCMEVLHDDLNYGVEF